MKEHHQDERQAESFHELSEAICGLAGVMLQLTNEISQLNLRTWQATLTDSPVTNAIDPSVPFQFYRAIEMNQTNEVKLSLVKLWLLNTNVNPPICGRWH